MLRNTWVEIINLWHLCVKNLDELCSSDILMMYKTMRFSICCMIFVPVARIVFEARIIPNISLGSEFTYSIL